MTWRASYAEVVEVRDVAGLPRFRDRVACYARPDVAALAVVTACLLLCTRAARADTIDTSVRQLDGDNELQGPARRRALARRSRTTRARCSRSPRAPQATTTPRSAASSALALEKMIDARTAEDARELGIDALEQAATVDADPQGARDRGRARCKVARGAAASRKRGKSEQARRVRQRRPDDRSVEAAPTAASDRLDEDREEEHRAHRLLDELARRAADAAELTSSTVARVHRRRRR